MEEGQYSTSNKGKRMELLTKKEIQKYEEQLKKELESIQNDLTRRRIDIFSSKIITLKEILEKSSTFSKEEIDDFFIFEETKKLMNKIIKSFGADSLITKTAMEIYPN